MTNAPDETKILERIVSDLLDYARVEREALSDDRRRENREMMVLKLSHALRRFNKGEERECALMQVALHRYLIAMIQTPAFQLIDEASWID